MKALIITLIILATGFTAAEAQVCDPNGPQPQEACFPSNPAPPANPNQGSPDAPGSVEARKLAMCEETVEVAVGVLEQFDRELRSCYSKLAKKKRK
jgi:hypothetical protein